MADAASATGVLVNAYGGYLLRTKPEGVDEGGVASGYSVLNSVILDHASEDGHHADTKAPAATWTA